MSGGDDYLWDRSGEPDPEIERLEKALRPLRSRRGAPGLGAIVPEFRRRALRDRLPLLAAAAALVLALAAVFVRGPAPDEGWELSWLSGASWPEARVVREERLGVGRWIETGEGDRARIRVGEIGEVELEPETRVGLVDAGERVHHLSLAHGVLHAMVWAPPGQFVVDTPSAVAVDMGCRYTLEVGLDGAGLLRVESGWVGFENRGLQSLVPAGAVCATRPGIGPGTPRYETASPAFAADLATVDFGPPGEARRAALAHLLGEAREHDGLSLWHLLSRLDGDDRGRVFDRLAALVPPPAEVTREGVLRGDRAMRDAWWGELGLGSAEFWRDWTGSWADSAAARQR